MKVVNDESIIPALFKDVPENDVFLLNEKACLKLTEVLNNEKSKFNSIQLETGSLLLVGPTTGVGHATDAVLHIND